MVKEGKIRGNLRKVHAGEGPALFSMLKIIGLFNSVRMSWAGERGYAWERREMYTKVW
jgi:hypothetical protein